MHFGVFSQLFGLDCVVVSIFIAEVVVDDGTRIFMFLIGNFPANFFK